MSARSGLLTLLIFVAACSESAVRHGGELFDDPSVSTAGSNAFRCSTCHETTPTRNRLLPGYTMWNVTKRSSWWGGSSLTLLDAINQCVTNFMRGRALGSTDEQARALHVYLDSLSPDAQAGALPLTVVANIVDVKSGDGNQGKTVYEQACGNCHGAPHTAEGRISGAASTIPDATLDSFGADPIKGARPITIEKVRHGKFFSVGGNMPLFSLEALTEEQLGSVLAYLEGFGLPPGGSM